MSFHLDYLLVALREGIPYIPLTLKLTVITFAFSVVFALVIATVRFYKIPVLSQILGFFVSIYMGIPTVLALNLYYLILILSFRNFADFFHLSMTLQDVDIMIVAYVTMILSNTVWISENFRGAYKAIEPVQFEAGDSIGYSKFKTWRRIILPQIFPITLPNLINWLTGIVKNVCFISTIGLMEVMNACLKNSAATYSYLEGYVAASIIYWLIVAAIEQIGKVVEKKSSKFRRYAH